jgi:uncharacterized protein YjeT (DUF2065 family)
MAEIIKTLGIIFIILGVVLFLRPQTIRDFISFAKVGKRIYIGGAVRIVIGVLILASVKHVMLPWIPGVIGALAVISGISVFAMGMVRIHAMLDRIALLSETRLRLLPIVHAVIGALLIYSA